MLTGQIRAEPLSSGQLLLTVPEAAQRLRISRSLMYELISSGDIKSIHVGRLRRVPTQALADYVERQPSTPIVGK